MSRLTAQAGIAFLPFWTCLMMAASCRHYSTMISRTVATVYKEEMIYLLSRDVPCCAPRPSICECGMRILSVLMVVRVQGVNSL